MKMRPAPGTIVLSLVVLAAVLTGCSEESDHVQWSDLTGGEQVYVRRLVVLERAKAVYLVDRETGAVLLDSLAVAWGDSVQARTVAGAPLEPGRSALVHDLLNRILIAEKDSLVTAPRPDRLTAPLPDPPPRPTEG